jgi:uncharacterized protein YbaA (DUF1428 family)
MKTYVDGFVIPIKKTKIKQYKKMATLGCKVWMEHGALAYYECVGDDMQQNWGLPFKKLCKLKPTETVVFAFIVYKSKADRNRVNAKVMSDPRMNAHGDGKMEMPFDMKRFSMAGFKTMVSKRR